MLFFTQLLRLPFAGLSRLWPLALPRCSWWNRLLAFFGWQPAKTVAATPGEVEKSGPKTEAGAVEKKPYPKIIDIIGIAGEWERELHPNWPETAFRIPDEIPYGTIYYVRKGIEVGYGMTARVERVPSGHVVKTPNANPYNLREEEEHLRFMRIEAELYRRLGDCPYIPRMLAWDPDTCCLSLEYLEHGPLGYYILGKQPPYDEIKPPTIEPALRQRWALQATRGLRAVHAAGVIHGDLTPRNLLLGADWNVRVADFAGSCVDGAGYLLCAGERYLAPGWEFNKTPEVADDLFLLGGVLYLIMTGNEPHHDVEDEFDVAKLYGAGTFPDVASIDIGAVIQGCWHRSLTSADEVLEQLLAVFGKDEDPWVAAKLEAF